MSKLIEDLHALQTLVSLGDNASAQQKAQIEALRAEVPTPIASHFFRQVASGRRGIALVRNGVCGECHLRLSHSMVHMLARSNDLLVCESCGSFVTLAAEDKATLSAQIAAAAAKARTARKPRAVAV